MSTPTSILPTIFEDSTDLLKSLEESYAKRIHKYLTELIELNEEFEGVQIMSSIEELKTKIIVGGEFFYVSKIDINSVKYSGVITYYTTDIIKTDTNVFMYEYFNNMFVLYRPYTDNKVSILLHKLKHIIDETEYKTFCNRLQFELTYNKITDDSDDSDSSDDISF